MPPRYLIRDKGTKKAAHIWTGSDTLCKLWSTGGMRKSKGYSVHEDQQGLELCQMCLNVSRHIGGNPYRSDTRATAGEE